MYFLDATSRLEILDSSGTGLLMGGLVVVGEEGKSGGGGGGVPPLTHNRHRLAAAFQQLFVCLLLSIDALPCHA